MKPIIPRALIGLLAIAMVGAGFALVWLWSTPEPSAPIPGLGMVPSARIEPLHSELWRPEPSASEAKEFPRLAEGAPVIEVSRPEPIVLESTPVTPEVPREFDLTVPEGASLPLVLVEKAEDLDPDSPTDQNRLRLLDSLATNFARKVAAAQAASPSAEETQRRWQEAAAEADEDYRAFFGVDAYQESLMRNHLARRAQ